MRSKIGIYSGTFDPIHMGHIGFAKRATLMCNLDKVVLLPERQPRAKSHVLDFGHRVVMLNRAIQSEDKLEVLELEQQFFTVNETLPLIQDLYKDCRLVLLIGSDSVSTFEYRWPGIKLLFQTVDLVIGIRAGDNRPVVEAVIKKLENNLNLAINYTIIDSPLAGLNSSTIRQNLSDKLGDVPQEVLSYIKQHKLYSKA